MPLYCYPQLGPFVDINTLKLLNFSSYRRNVPIDLDRVCRYEVEKFYGLNSWPSPQFGLSKHRPTLKFTRFELYVYNSSPRLVSPAIDGITYLTDTVQIGGFIRVKNFIDSNSDEVRDWIVNHFIFNMVTLDNKYQGYWHYTDLLWTPGPNSIPSPFFTPRPDTVYVCLIPC